MKSESSIYTLSMDSKLSPNEIQNGTLVIVIMHPSKQNFVRAHWQLSPFYPYLETKGYVISF